MPKKPMLRATVWGLLALGCLPPAFANAFNAEEFETELQQSSRRYADVAEQNEVRQLLIAGKLDAYHERLAQLAPDRDKTFYDYFVLANLFFQEDRAQSYAYMLKAEALEPDNPYLWYERGIHEHRTRNCDSALTYYRRLHNQYPDIAIPVSWAYRTHCALVVGEYDEAFSAWRKANFSARHTAIEKGMYTIFSASRPDSTRQDLIVRIESGEHQAICDLLHHDRNWEIDWWNRSARDEYVTYDGEIARALIADGSADEAVIRLCIDAPKLSDEDFESALTEAGIWGENAELPDAPALLYDMALRLTSSGQAQPADLIDRLGSQMWERFTEGSRERQFLEVLGFLYSSTGDSARLREVDAYGWRTLKLERFAASYLMGTDPQSDQYGELLDEALSGFPNSALLNKLQMARSANGPDSARSMANYVAAEFANVKENWKGPYRLSDFMASFQYELGKLTQ